MRHIEIRELAAKTGLAVVAVLFALVIFEVAVRWLHLEPDRFWEPDPILGVRLIPGHQGWWTQEAREFVVPVQINGRGLRDAERNYAKPPGVFRLLILGDSMVEAMQVPLEATFARLLEENLNAGDAAPRVEVVSAGVSGYGTANQLLYLEDEGKRYEPDLVMLAFYLGNDVKNNSPTLEETLRPVYAADGTLERVAGKTPQRRPTGWSGLLARSVAYRYVRRTLLTGLLQSKARRVVPIRDGIPVDYGVYAPSLTPEWQDAWTLTERLLTQLKQAVAAKGARLMVAVLCSSYQIYSQSWQETMTAYPHMRGRSWDLDGPDRRILAWCAEHNVPCVTLAPEFRAAAAQNGTPLHFRHDRHWTVAGHRLAASVVTSFLDQHQLVPVELRTARKYDD